MRLLALLLVLCGSISAYANEGDGAFFLNSYQRFSFTCAGTKFVRGESVGDFDQIRIRISGVETTTPMIEVSGPEAYFKIGNSFAGSLSKSSSCRYYSTQLAMYYVCGLTDPTTPLTFQDVMRSNRRSSISRDRICSDQFTCLHLRSCQDSY